MVPFTFCNEARAGGVTERSRNCNSACSTVTVLISTLGNPTVAVFVSIPSSDFTWEKARLMALPPESVGAVAVAASFVAETSPNAFVRTRARTLITLFVSMTTRAATSFNVMFVTVTPGGFKFAVMPSK